MFVRRLVEGVFFSVIGAFGFLGNLTSILILITPQVHILKIKQKGKTFSFSSQVLRMLSDVTLYCQITMIVRSEGSQLSCVHKMSYVALKSMSLSIQ